MSTIINSKFILPCGVKIDNRIAKAATTEGLADPENHASDKLQRLYSHWSKSGAGLLITGNVQVDRRYMERPGNVAIENKTGLEQLKKWAAAGTQGGCHLWMQISHAGRQTPRHINPQPVGPSAIGVEGKSKGYCNPPRSLSGKEIKDIIQRFALTAAIAREAGFTGVQIHAAHGYLLSSFLSPLANQRTDEWGGTLHNRARLLLEIVHAIRNKVGADFPIAVKLNSADFQKGGFAAEDSQQVAQWLDKENLDLLEISGGNYENPVMMKVLESGQSWNNNSESNSSSVREAYFLDYSQILRKIVQMPLLVTGGFRSHKIINKALDQGSLDLVGMARPFIVAPDFARSLLRGTGDAPTFQDSHSLFWFYLQLFRLGEGLDIDPNIDTTFASTQCMVQDMRIANALATRELS